ncbi:MAG: hypothetical protein HW387_1176 [Parachlamydiales bacterium]|nr:hypothetical protein [Parachlamydiales bacterium]
MQGLILDTSCNRSYILLAQDGQVLAYLPMNGGENLSKNLGLEIEELLLERRSLFAPLKEAVRLKPHTASHKIACLDPPLKGRDCGKQCVHHRFERILWPWERGRDHTPASASALRWPNPWLLAGAFPSWDFAA